MERNTAGREPQEIDVIKVLYMVMVLDLVDDGI